MRAALLTCLVASAIGSGLANRHDTAALDGGERREVQAPIAAIDGGPLRRLEAPSRPAARCFELGPADLPWSSAGPRGIASASGFHRECGDGISSRSIQAHGARAPPALS